MPTESAPRNIVSRSLVFLECVLILAPLSLFAAIGFTAIWSTVSRGLIYATLNPVGMPVVATIAVIALCCAWVLAVRYITAGPQGLAQSSGLLYLAVALGGAAGGYGALRLVGPASLYGFGLAVFIPWAHLLVAHRLYLRSQGATLADPAGTQAATTRRQ